MKSENVFRAAMDDASDRIWGEPDRTIIESRRKPPEIPLQILGGWQTWIKATAQSRSAPVDYVAVSLLSLLSSVIENSRRASPWDGWVEPVTLWTAMVGNPSSGKSPGIDAVLSLVRELEKDLVGDFPEELLAWETEKMAAKENRTKWEDDVKTAVKNGSPPPQMPQKASEPEKPVRPRIIVTDATIESLARLLSHLPRGLMLNRDELSGWLESFNRYSGGGDRPFWIEAYGGRPYVVDRQKNDEPLQIPYLSISVLGGIQPDKLVKLLVNSDDDGLASRILTVWPNPIPPKRPTVSPNDYEPLQAMRSLLNLKMGSDEDGNLLPVVVRFEDAASDLFDQWRNENAEKQKWASGLYLSHLGKMPGIVVRLSLILELMNWAISPSNHQEPEYISCKSFASAAGLVDEYFLPMAERTYGDAAMPTVERHAAILARQILRRQSEKINTREIGREWKLPGLKEAAAIHIACEYLQDANWIDKTSSRSGNTSGRSKADFLVNPKLWRMTWDIG